VAVRIELDKARLHGLSTLFVRLQVSVHAVQDL